MSSIIDSHFHAWQPARGDYGWLTPALGPLYRDVSIADWRAVSAPHGVGGGVLVQAAPTEAETWFLLGLAAADEAVRGVVGWVDLLAPDAPQRIARLAKQHAKLKGLRPMLQDIADPDWILQRELDPAFSSMVEHGLVFDALVKPQHLPRIVTLARRHRSLRIVVDHGAKPDIAGAWQPWADDLQRIAMQTNADCKLSGLLTEAGPAPPPDAARRHAQHLLACFGTRRVLWGSDWPVLELAADYATWWGEVQALLAPLAPAERAMVLGGNAIRAYRL